MRDIVHMPVSGSLGIGLQILNAPRNGLQQPGQSHQQCALAGPIGPAQHQRRSRLQRKAQRCHNGPPAPAQRQGVNAKPGFRHAGKPFNVHAKALLNQSPGWQVQIGFIIERAKKVGEKLCFPASCLRTSRWPLQRCIVFRREIGRLARSQSGVPATLLRQGGPRDRDIQ